MVADAPESQIGLPTCVIDHIWQSTERSRALEPVPYLGVAVLKEVVSKCVSG